jgi:hypothetical protein
MRHGVRIRGLAGAVATVFGLASLLLLFVPVGAQAQQRGVIQPDATVNWSQLPPAHLDPGPVVYHQLAHRLTRDPAALAAAKAQAQGRRAGGAAPDAVPGPLNVNLLTNFIGLTFTDSGGFIPPDNATAAGPSHIFQMINVRGAVFNKTTGAKIGANINLGTFFGTGGQGLSDPILRYDPTSNRWFAAIITTSGVLKWVLAVSTTNDPTGTWVLYSFAPNPANLPDYPNMGISGDKVVLTANAFNPGFLGTEFVVFNKAELVAGGATHTTFFGPDATNFTLRAAQNLSADNNIYMTSHSGAQNTTTMRVYTVTGVPTAIANASETHVSRTVLALGIPPDAEQSGGAPLIATNDNRFLEAQFRGSSLYTTAAVSCMPSGDASQRSCVRAIEILNPGTTATVNQDFNFGLNGIYMYFPALAPTSAGDVIAVFSRSSSTEFAGVWGSGRLSTDPPNTFQTSTLIKAGEAHYNPFASRWGDYSSAAIDPSDQTKVWVSGEYACPGGCANGSNWGTWIAQTSISAGAVSTVTGTILIDGAGQLGKTVKLKQGAVVIGTTTTNGSGAYTFSSVNPGTYKVVIKKLSGAGTYSGNISVNSVGEASKTVRISNGGGSTTTNGSGNFSQAGVPAGNHMVKILNVDVP